MANEKRLIDANALTKLMCRACNNECCEEPCEPGECFMYDAINNAPTVDAVEVVRCKDCKHWTMGYCNHFAYYSYEPITNEDDFCSYGERKDNERKAD